MRNSGNTKLEGYSYRFHYASTEFASKPGYENSQGVDTSCGFITLILRDFYNLTLTDEDFLKFESLLRSAVDESLKKTDQPEATKELVMFLKEKGGVELDGGDSVLIQQIQEWAVRLAGFNDNFHIVAPKSWGAWSREYGSAYRVCEFLADYEHKEILQGLEKRLDAKINEVKKTCTFVKPEEWINLEVLVIPNKGKDISDVKKLLKWFGFENMEITNVPSDGSKPVNSSDGFDNPDENENFFRALAGRSFVSVNQDGLLTKFLENTGIKLLSAIPGRSVEH